MMGEFDPYRPRNPKKDGKPKGRTRPEELPPEVTRRTQGAAEPTISIRTADGRSTGDIPMTAPVPFDASDLAATVERARALLDDGDVIAARFLAAAAYEQAKAQGRLAEQFGAAERLVEKARRLQGDALLIETRALSRIADDYDAAQAAGMIGKQGQRSDLVADDDKVPTAADFNLTRQAIHEARKLRDAERRSPGIVERAIAARLALRLSPNRANLRAAVGTDSATAAERGNNLYETPPEAMRALLCLTRFSRRIYEPACGKGAIVRPLEDAGYELALSDLVDYGTATRHGECQGVADFMSVGRADGVYDIVTNPPYGADLNRFVAHALRVHRPRKMALLLNLNFLAGFDDPDRCFAMDECPPATVYVFTRRLPMMHRDGWDGPEAASRMNTAWFVWELDEATQSYDAAGKRGTQLVRIDWKTFETSTPCGPADDADETAERVISPPEGEMPGRAEGGAVPPTQGIDRPSVTSDELDEWRLLGLIDGGMRVTGEAVEALTEQGLIWGGKELTVGGAKRLAELEPRIKAASDGDAVNVVDSGTASPSVLPDISPTGGEIKQPKRRGKAAKAVPA